MKFQVEFNPAVIAAWKLIGCSDRWRPSALTLASAVTELGLVLRDDRRNLERWE